MIFQKLFLIRIVHTTQHTAMARRTTTPATPAPLRETKDQLLAIRITNEEFAAFKYYADKEDRTLASIGRIAIRSWIKQTGLIEQMKADANAKKANLP